MGVALVTGVHNSGKSEILKLVMRQYSASTIRVEYMTFDDIIKAALKKADLLLSMNKINHGHMRMIQRHLRKEIPRKMARRKNALISGYLTMRTHHGYVPLLDSSAVNLINPDVIILIELETNPENLYVRHLMGKHPGMVEKIRHHQYINRQYATIYSSMSGAVVKTITVEHDNIKKAVDETAEAVRYFMV